MCSRLEEIALSSLLAEWIDIEGKREQIHGDEARLGLMLMRCFVCWMDGQLPW